MFYAHDLGLERDTVYGGTEYKVNEKETVNGGFFIIDYSRGSIAVFIARLDIRYFEEIILAIYLVRHRLLATILENTLPDAGAIDKKDGLFKRFLVAGASITE